MTWLLSGVLHDSSLPPHLVQQTADTVSDTVRETVRAGDGPRSGQVIVAAMEAFDTYSIENAGMILHVR